MPATRQFHTVTLRAVDNMNAAIASAAPRAVHQLLFLAGSAPTLPPDFSLGPSLPMPNSATSVLLCAFRA
jgi:16S rRNA (guanine527-N7)-methyltransferase